MAEAYKELWSNVLNFSGISFNCLLAKDSGMFNTLLNADRALTSTEIADQNNLKERYTREILGSLSVSKLVRLSTRADGTPVYDMEDHAKTYLKDGLSLEFLCFNKTLMARYDSIRACLDKDTTPELRFTDTYFDNKDEEADKSKKEKADFFLNNIPHLRERLESGIDVIEFGCGRGHVVSHLASLFPLSSFTASEVSAELVAELQRRYGHIPNMKFKQVDLCAVPSSVESRYDWAFSVKVIHDLPYPLEALKGIRRLVREKDSVFTSLDVAGSGNLQGDVGDLRVAALYSFSTFLCLPESYQGGDDSEAHGNNMPQDTVVTLTVKAGFDVKVIPYDKHIAVYLATPV